MAARHFLLPMVGPADGKGTRADPWRPKYLRELGLSYSIRNGRDFCLAEVWGDEKALEQLAAMPDVEEVLDTDAPVEAGKLARTEAATKNLPLSRKGTGKELLLSLRQSIHDKQVAERPQRVGDAVKGAIRAGN
jgi:hypothetical protein